MNASILSYNPICFGRQFNARGPQTVNEWLSRVLYLNCESSGYMVHWISCNLFCFLKGDHSLVVVWCLSKESFEDDKQCFEFNVVFACAVSKIFQGRVARINNHNHLKWYDIITHPNRKCSNYVYGEECRVDKNKHYLRRDNKANITQSMIIL